MSGRAKKPGDTSMGKGMEGPSATDWSLLRAGGAGGRESLEALARKYWRPVYRFLRASCAKNVEDAKDLAQDFFAETFSPEFLQAADPRIGNFRRFLLTCVHNFARNSDRDSRTLRKGGGRRSLSMDELMENDPGGGPEDPGLTPEQAFNRAWAREILDRAAAELSARYAAAGKQAAFEAFRRYHLDGETPSRSYGEIAAELGLKPHDVQNALRAARRDFRVLCRRIVREGLLAGEDIESELDQLFSKP